MLTFVIPLKSRKASKSWDYVSKLFERCVKSVCNQTSSNFKAIVVCHDKPHLEFTHPSLTYIQVDLPEPDSSFGAKTLDRDKKVVIGLTLAQKFQPSHVMVVDADDCVSKRLTEFVEQNSQCNGWFIDKGYQYQDGSKSIRLIKNFYRVCASCNIIKLDLQALPESTKFDSPYEYIVSHEQLRGSLEEKGTPLAPLPFVGAVYISAAIKENLTYQRDFYDRLRNQEFKQILSPMKKAVLNAFASQRLDTSIQEEFSLYDINFNKTQS